MKEKTFTMAEFNMIHKLAEIGIKITDFYLINQIVGAYILFASNHGKVNKEVKDLYEKLGKLFVEE